MGALHYLPAAKRTPPDYQPMVTPLHPIDRQAYDFWDAVQIIHSEPRTLGSIIYGKRAGAEGTLCRLRLKAALPSIRDRAEQVLIEEGCIVPPLNPWVLA